MRPPLPRRPSSIRQAVARVAHRLREGVERAAVRVEGAERKGREAQEVRAVTLGALEQLKAKAGCFMALEERSTAARWAKGRGQRPRAPA